MTDKVFVIAGNKHQYEDYRKRKYAEEYLKTGMQGGQKIHRSFYYVHDEYTLRGVRNPHGVFVGTWRDRKDILQILETLIVSSEDNQRLIDIKTELWKKATHDQLLEVASAKVRDHIDNEVIGTLLPKYIGPTDFLHNDFIVKVTS